MQSPPVDQESPALRDRLLSIYNSRPPAAALLPPTVSMPLTPGDAVDRIRGNMVKFAFYYMALIAAVDLVFVLFHRLLILPALLTGAFVWAAINGPLTVGEGFEVTPMMAVGGCVGMHFVMCLLWRKMASEYLWFALLNGVLCLVTAVHGSVLEKEEEAVEPV